MATHRARQRPLRDSDVDVGDWLEYSVEVRVTKGVHDLHAHAEGRQAFHMEFDRKNLTGSVAVPNTGGWGSDLMGRDCFQEAVVRHVRLQKFAARLRFVPDGAAGEKDLLTVDKFRFELEKAGRAQSESVLAYDRDPSTRLRADRADRACAPSTPVDIIPMHEAGTASRRVVDSFKGSIPIMRCYQCVLPAMALIGSTAFGFAGPPPVTIDFADQRQRITGFGASGGNDSANDFLKMTPANRTHLCDLLFDREKGIGLSMLRSELFARIEPSAGVWDWTKDEAQVWLMTEPGRGGGLHLERHPERPGVDEGKQRRQQGRAHQRFDRGREAAVRRRRLRCTKRDALGEAGRGSRDRGWLRRNACRPQRDDIRRRRRSAAEAVITALA